MRTGYTQQEQDTLISWCEIEAPKGFVDTREAGELILNQLGNQSVTIESLNQAANALRAAGYPIYKSQAHLEWEQAIKPLSQSQREVLAKWMDSNKRLRSDGDAGYKNCTAVVSWILARGYSFDAQGLTNALTNIINNSPNALYWNSVEEAYTPGRHSGKSFAPDKKEDERAFIGGRVNHARSEHVVNQSGKAVKDSYWQERAEAAGNSANLHSRKAILRAMFVTVPGTSDIDWQQTALARERAAK